MRTIPKRRLCRRVCGGVLCWSGSQRPKGDCSRSAGRAAACSEGRRNQVLSIVRRRQQWKLVEQGRNDDPRAAIRAALVHAKAIGERHEVG